MPTKNFSATNRAYEKILTYIRTKNFKAGEKLTGERELSEKLDFSRTTIRKALNLLETNGILNVIPQKGWFIAGKTGIADNTNKLESFSELAHAKGFVPSASVKNQKIRSSTLKEAEIFGIVAGSQVFELCRIRMLNNFIICYEETVLPLKSCEKIINFDFNKESLFQALKNEHSLEILAGNYTIKSVLANKNLAEILEVNINHPILEVYSECVNHEADAVLKTKMSYRGDSYQFQTSLYR